MLAETQEIVSELESLRSGKLRVASFPQPLRLKVIALAQSQGLQKTGASCNICPSTIRKWPEFVAQKSIADGAGKKYKKKVHAPNFTVTQITTQPILPDNTPAIISVIRPDGSTLQVPENSKFAEKMISLFLANI